MLEPWMRPWRLPCKDSSTFSRLKLAPSSFSSWTIRLSKKRERRFRAALGIRIMLKTWPTPLANNGFWPFCSTNGRFCPWPPASIIHKAPKDAVASTPKSIWPRRCFKVSACRFPVNFIFWPTVGIEPEKQKKDRYLVCTNLLLPALEVLKFYTRRFKIEQLVKGLKHRLGLGDYQVRNLPAIQRHVTLALLIYFTLIFLKILQWLRDKSVSLNISIRFLAFQIRKHILVERITVELKTLKIQFKQNILDTYLEHLCG